ncbi:MAG: molybdate ABC transporter substrate-binding protein [Rhizobiaceae bacterium]|nr:molybdate ABC transporter substrate-binding protein [Rhizobiaceae bacterium]
MFALKFTRRAMLALAALAAFSLPVAAPASAQENVTIFAAASMKNALDAVAASWTGGKTTISYAASSALAKQIAEGAPADIFVSADLAWMQYLSEKNLTKKDTETQLLGNRIVLIAPAGSTANATLEKGFDLAGLLAGGKLAMANVDSVPAGKYGKAALETLGMWDSVSASVAQAENVRAAMALVSTGEAAAGIVYATDAAAEPKVKVLATFPADSHPAIIYPVAVLAESKSGAAADFLRYMQTDSARKLFEAQGFSVLTPPVSN